MTCRDSGGSTSRRCSASRSSSPRQRRHLRLGAPLVHLLGPGWATIPAARVGRVRRRQVLLRRPRARSSRARGARARLLVGAVQGTRDPVADHPRAPLRARGCGDRDDERHGHQRGPAALADPRALAREGRQLGRASRLGPLRRLLGLFLVILLPATSSMAPVPALVVLVFSGALVYVGATFAFARRVVRPMWGGLRGARAVR